MIRKDTTSNNSQTIKMNFIHSFILIPEHKCQAPAQGWGKSKEQKRGLLPSWSYFLVGGRGVAKYILEARNIITKIDRWTGRQGGYWMVQKDLMRKVTFKEISRG